MRLEEAEGIPIDPILPTRRQPYLEEYLQVVFLSSDALRGLVRLLILFQYSEKPIAFFFLLIEVTRINRTHLRIGVDSLNRSVIHAA